MIRLLLTALLLIAISTSTHTVRYTYAQTDTSPVVAESSRGITTRLEDGIITALGSDAEAESSLPLRSLIQTLGVMYILGAIVTTTIIIVLYTHLRRMR